MALRTAAVSLPCGGALYTTIGVPSEIKNLHKGLHIPLERLFGTLTKHTGKQKRRPANR